MVRYVIKRRRHLSSQLKALACPPICSMHFASIELKNGELNLTQRMRLVEDDWRLSSPPRFEVPGRTILRKPESWYCLFNEEIASTKTCMREAGRDVSGGERIS